MPMMLAIFTFIRRMFRLPPFFVKKVIPMDKGKPNTSVACAMNTAMTNLMVVEQMMGDSSVEKVLCFPRELLSELGTFTDGFLASGLLASVQESLSRVFASGLMEFVDRTEAEVSEEWIQLIPYCLISRGRELFLYQRKGSEGRLSGLFSLGIGGHINPVDGLDVDAPTYYRALRRELQEEIGFDCGDVTPYPLGLIYDPSNAVGKVHMGVVHVVNVPNHFRVKSEDPAITNGDFWPVSEVLFKVKGEKALYETWTQLVVKHVLT